MDSHILSRAGKYLSKQRKRARWQKIICILAAIVVFGTTYALILPAVTMERNLICGKEEHVHTDECYTAQSTLVCEQEEGEEHTHSDECYQTESVLICEKEEHVHDDNCYETSGSDPNADIETQRDWEKTMEQVTLTGDWSEDVLAIAESQLGYHESTRNYIETESGRTKGYTRYGAWYGDPYGDWCAMFVSFCLHYAEVENIPQEANCNRWIEELQKEEYDLYREADQYTPVSGDLIFFNNNDSNDTENGEVSDHVGLVKEVTETTVKTIEGNSSDRVQYVEYDLTDKHIMGYGQLPEELKEDEAADTSDVVDMAKIDEVIQKIDALPSSQEIEDKLTEYEEAGADEEYDSYYEKVHSEIVPVYIQYQALEETLQEKVTNRDKLLELEWIWGVMTFSTTDTVNVTAVNSHNYSATIIYHSDSGMSVGNNTSGEKNYAYWTAVRVEKENGVFIVKEIISADGTSKSNLWASGEGFILLFHENNVNASVNVNVGDVAIVSSDFWKSTHSYTGTVYGTVTFNAAAAQKNTKDNSDQLHIVNSANTRDFIELNLYDYGSGSTGKNINDKFNDDRKMPGFQQSGGTDNIASLDAFKSTGYMNFGDIITDDLADGRLVTVASENPQGINVVMDTANSPISRYSEVMNKSLGQDGYPALLDGTSLGYLFGAEDYSKKMNNQSVDGLFQYDETTGAYSFNSRENFAQFNSGSDTFTLYDEIFTPNFIMYPFGNFMPFNDIVHDSKQVSQINENYFEELRLQANYLYQQGKGDQYAQLANVLGQFMDYAKQDNWGDDWTAERALEHYFYWGSELPKDDENNFNQISLDRLYSLDYDVESDFYFGMDMKMNFMQPKGGLTGKDGQQPMVFYFTGDDDVWVYIDDVLFLDLSGIHRHVGGEIDFVNGVVKYYSLDTMTGDVSTTPYKTVKFSELVDPGLLNEKGTFKDYSTHSFNFFYMERGSGSSVCRMNFNFPLLRKNSIAVTKEFSVDEQDRLDLLGNPDFKFQVLKEGGNELFIGDNTSYDIYDSNQNKIGSGTTDANGVFTIKANQTAVFGDIPENSGKYFVRELLDSDAFSQYGTISVDGSTQTQNYDVAVGSDQFKGVDSTVKDMSSGSTAFTFNNQIILNKSGSLEIEKKVEGDQTDLDQEFQFNVTLDGTELPVNTLYTVTKTDGTTENKTVKEAGVVSLKANEKVTISNIIAGSRFTVQEAEESSKGYAVTYSGNGITTSGENATGIIKTDTLVKVTVTNAERGTSVTIPITKNLENPDGGEHAYSFQLTQVTDQSGNNDVENGTSKGVQIVFHGEETKHTENFVLSYLERDMSDFPVTFYYRISEKKDENDLSTEYDQTVYVTEVVVEKNNDGLSATVTNLWKNGEVIKPVEAVTFTNKQLRSLTISKKVEGVSDESQEFTFAVTLSYNGAPLTGTYSCIRRVTDGTESTESIILNELGKTEITLKDGESLKINGLPYGADWNAGEQNPGSYEPRYIIGSNSEKEGETATGQVIEGSDTIQFINYSTYELPESGGSGTKWFTIGGLMLIFGAFLLYKKLKQRKEASTSNY